MDIISIKYEMEPFDSFEEVVIYENNGKFKIGLLTSRNTQSFIVFQDIIVGGFAYLNNKKDIDKAAKFFTSFDECIEYLKNITTKSFLKTFKKGQIEYIGFLISVQSGNIKNLIS